MPPWSSKLLSPSSRNEAGPNPAEGPSTSPARQRPRVSEADILENAYGIPSLPPPSHTSYGASNTSKSRRSPGHGRSVSHPFPSLFSANKKRDGASVPAAGFESTDEEAVSHVAARNITQNPASKQKVPDKDLMTGKCMTCDSMVRWPKQLLVFRCTVCLTINDLKPIALDTCQGDSPKHSLFTKSATFPMPESPRKVPLLSIGKTRRIVDQCVTAYLLERLSHVDGPSSSPTPPQPQPPKWMELDVHTARKLWTSETTNSEASPSDVRNLPVRISERSPNNMSDLDHSSADITQQGSSQYSKSTPGSFFEAHMNSRHRARRTDFAKTASEGHDLLLDENGSGQARIERVSSAKNIFKPLEDHITTSFGSFDCINNSFSTVRPSMAPRAKSEGTKQIMSTQINERPLRDDSQLSEMDAKTLLLGTFAENGSWWTGSRPELRSPGKSRTYRGDGSHDHAEIVTVKTPRIEWLELNEWYHIVLNPSKSWRSKLDEVLSADVDASRLHKPSEIELREMEECLMEAESHAQRVLLKSVESLLKRPSRPLTEPSHLRFLLIIMMNPLLYPTNATSMVVPWSHPSSREQKIPGHSDSNKKPTYSKSAGKSDSNRGSAGQHSGIIKRIFGLLSNAPNECHHYIVSWFARFSDNQFQRLTDLVGSFVTYRLIRQHGKKREVEHDLTAGLVPSIGGPGRATSAALHAALGSSSQVQKKSDGKPKPVIYDDDWQIKAAARVMSLLFSANNSGLARRGESRTILTASEGSHSEGRAARERARNHGQILPISDFYNTLLDYSDLIADFESWESRRSKFAFCQYPFFLSIWAKIQIMEHDARRQMEVKAREAFFDSIMTHKSVNQYLILRIRRDCLVEDSLVGVGQVIGSGGEEIKKGLRIEFRGEEGIDAGGLRKEWFLLLVRDLFSTEHGMFSYDDDSGFCYFNPHSFETTDQYFLVGVVLGLAIYNSTILDVALPPFAFRKLLAAAPPAGTGATSHAKPSMIYTLDDLAQYRPTLARGLRLLLEYDGDVESTFCRDFVADVDRYGQITQVPLCADGEKKAVTNANRREFVDLYVRYLLDTSVTRQFEPFKRGFFTVCGGNALSLFRAEEIELLIRGSDEPLDIASLRAVSKYENWGEPNPAAIEPVIQWFWKSFEAANPKDQRKMLTFITGSDRIPAMGATNLVIKISRLGEDSPRYPSARTCFNTLSLWRYSSKEKLEYMLWRAVNESEGFGLK